MNMGDASKKAQPTHIHHGGYKMKKNGPNMLDKRQGILESRKITYFPI
jgi:hypothetical protein